MFSLTVVSVMEVPRRPQPVPFPLSLPKPVPSDLLPLGAEHTKDESAESDRFGEDVFTAAGYTDESSASTVNSKLCPQDSFSEEVVAQEAEEAKRKSEEEEAAAKERAAQRQALAVEELVQSERNYLRHLQVTTGTIRSNLQKLQVRRTKAGPDYF